MRKGWYLTDFNLWKCNILRKLAYHCHFLIFKNPNLDSYCVHILEDENRTLESSPNILFSDSSGVQFFI